jgi:hypothetical protein
MVTMVGRSFTGTILTLIRPAWRWTAAITFSMP